MRITVLNRGGLAVYGGSYDPKRRAAIADTDQQQTVEIIYPATITALAITQDGEMTIGTVTISGTKATFTISGTGSLEAIATMGDERPKVVIEAETHRIDGYGTA
jgi:hypothetical protein